MSEPQLDGVMKWVAEFMDSDPAELDALIERMVLDIPAMREASAALLAFGVAYSTDKHREDGDIPQEITDRVQNMVDALKDNSLHPRALTMEDLSTMLISAMMFAMYAQEKVTES